MKLKKLVFCVALVFLIFGSQAQTYFKSDFSGISMDKDSIGYLPDTWTLYSDGNTPSGQVAALNRAWIVIDDDENGRTTGSTSYFTDTNKQADRWMITPQIDLSTATNPYLFYDARSADPRVPDSYEVLISTSGTEKTDFVKVYENTEYNSAMQRHVINLTKYAGEKVYVAFRLVSKNMFILLVGNISVNEVTGNKFTLSEFKLPEIIYDQKTKLIAYLFNEGKDSIQSFKTYYKVNNGETMFQSVTQVNMPNYAYISVNFGEYTFSRAGKHDFQIWVGDINDNVNNTSDTLYASVIYTDSKNLYPKNILLEEFTNAGATACAKMNPYIDTACIMNRANTEGTSLNVIKYPTDAPVNDMGYTSEVGKRYTYYYIDGVPSTYLNGGTNVMDLGISLYGDVTKVINKFVQEESIKKTPFDIKLKLETVGNKATAKVELSSEINLTSDFRLFVALLEDSVYHSDQGNGETKFRYMFRKFLTDTEGKSVAIQAGSTLEEEFSYTFNLSNPRIFNRSVANMSAVAFIQNVKSKEIHQSVYARAREVVGNENVKDTDFEAYLIPNPASEKTSLNFNLKTSGKVQVSVISTDGSYAVKLIDRNYTSGYQHIEIDTRSMTPGIYAVKVNTQEGSFTRKLVIL